MKRFFVSVLVLAAMLAVTTGTAFAGSALELVEVRNSDGGVTFIFRVTGEFSQDELNSGFVQVEGGGDFPLYCAQRDATTVVCHTTKKTGGSNVVVGFGGARFWTDVPEASHTPYCYKVWDWFPETNFAWVDVGPHCQDEEAQRYDWVEFYVPQYGYTDWVQFYDFDISTPPGVCGGVPYDGPAYYYPNCPDGDN
jgi:hypothetical protein